MSRPEKKSDFAVFLVCGCSMIYTQVAALDARHARADRARAALAGATRLGPDRAAAVAICVEINQ